MSTVNYGAQIQIFGYRQEATSANFNNLIKDVLPTGVYSGFGINKVLNNKISINIGTAIVSDGTYFLKFATTETTQQDIFCSTSAVYVVARWEYLSSTANYVEFLCTASPQANDLVLGKLVYSGPNLVSVDYSYRNYGNKGAEAFFLDSITSGLYLLPGTNFWFVDIDGYSISHIEILQKTLITNFSIAASYYLLYDGSSFSTVTSVTGLAFSTNKIGWYDSSGNRVLGLVSFDGVSTITIQFIYSGVDVSIPLSYLDTDPSMTANSDTKIASQKASKSNAIAAALVFG